MISKNQLLFGAVIIGCILSAAWGFFIVEVPKYAPPYSATAPTMPPLDSLAGFLETDKTSPPVLLSDLSFEEVQSGEEDALEGGEKADSDNAAPKQIALSSYQGKFLILNVWATWCTPCIAEFPSLGVLRTKLASDDRFEVVTVSVDASIQPLTGFIQKQGISNLPVLWDSKQVMLEELKAINPTFDGIPITLIVTPDGMVVAGFYGEADWGEDSVVTELKALADSTAVSLP